MIATTSVIKRELLTSNSVAERIARLKDKYAGRTGFLVSCGPSLNEVPGDVLREALRNELVIAVKQAYDLLQNDTDFHLLNSTSYKKYNYVDPAPIVLLERGADDAPIWGCKPDISFPVVGNDRSSTRAERLANRLAVRKNFDDFLLGRTPGRPWGPGIILELGMYLAVHIGVRNLIVIGWDLGPPKQTIYNHYYQTHSPFMQGPVGRFARRVARRGPFIALQWLRHVRGETYNHGTVESDDTQVSIDSSYETYEWLSSHGVHLSLLSSQSYLDPRIPRVTWPDVQEILRESREPTQRRA